MTNAQKPPSDYLWLNEASQIFLDNDYLLPGQTVDQRVTIICEAAERILKRPGFAERFKNNFKKGWYSFSTPIWVNFGNDRGLPISCFGSYTDDSIASILETHHEVGMMTKNGGGTSGYLGNIRERGAPITDNGEALGPVHFVSLFETLIKTVSQGSTRRGQFAAYLNIDHPDINEFLTIKSDGSDIQQTSFGVCVSDAWMQSMIDGDAAKRTTWAKVISARASTGYPYIFWTDNVNNNTVDVYKKLKMMILQSNLCTEIMLPNSIIESFVCDLASMNILHYEEWKNDPTAVEDLVYLLDAAMTEFIEKAKNEPFMHRAVKFAERHRALGIGWIGWHSYLQSKMIPFESMEAKYKNTEIAECIQKRAYAASAQMTAEYGEPELLKGYGRRHTTLCAIAPTKSSAFIIGQASEGIEPHRSNYIIKDLQKGKFSIRNKHLEDLLDAKGQNTMETWNSILKNSGSVQHLTFLTDHEKDVFLTMQEISPKEIIIQAAQRQKYIDQGQSINLMIHPLAPVKDVNQLLIDAWKLGIKSLYYQISVNAAQQLSRNILSCRSCDG